jgi:hypothetical protein
MAEADGGQDAEEVFLFLLGGEVGIGEGLGAHGDLRVSLSMLDQIIAWGVMR